MNYTRHFECGCKIVVIGELHNAKIEYCPKHKAAQDMYEALKKLLEGSEIDIESLDIPARTLVRATPSEEAILLGFQALAKAGSPIPKG